MRSINGKKVYSYEEVGEGYYIVSTYLYRKEIVEELEKRNIMPDKIILYDKQDIFYDIYHDLTRWKDCTEKIKAFREKHRGEECFVIGNGPSLQIKDLERLEGTVTFASNSIYALYKHTNWRPTYYCATDSIFCRQMMSEREDMTMLMDGCEAAFTSIMGEGIKYRDDADMARLYYMRLSGDMAGNGEVKFSADCSERIYAAGTITYDILQLAVYMGFKKIYLLGIDFNYSVERHRDHTVTNKDVCNHMKEIEEEEKRFYEPISRRHGTPYMADVDLQLAGYRAAKEYADTHGVAIYNATRGGKLEVFPRVDFDSLFGSISQ